MADLDTPIRSRSNPLFRRFRALKDRGDADLCLLEGPKLLEEALARRGRDRGGGGVAARGDGRARRATPGLAARRAEYRVRRMDADLVAALSEAETSQGVLALARRPPSTKTRSSAARR